MTRIMIDQSALLCAKCGQKKPLVRHHLGNDRFLGIWNKRIWKQYYEYNDCVKICDECHMKVHWVYKSQVDAIFFHKLTPRGASGLRRRFIKLGKLWLAGAYDPVKVDPVFKLKWDKGVRKYREAKG